MLLFGVVVMISLFGFIYNLVQFNVVYVVFMCDSICDNLFVLCVFFNEFVGMVVFDLLQNFCVNEKVYVVYVQLKYGFDFGSIIIDGLVGLCVVKIKVDIQVFLNIDGVVLLSVVNSEYIDYLLNGSVCIVFNDKLQVWLVYIKMCMWLNFFDFRLNLILGMLLIFLVGSFCFDFMSVIYNS